MENSFKKILTNPNSIASILVKKVNLDQEKALNWRWHFNNQVRDISSAEVYLSLDESEKQGFLKTQKLFHAGITPYYMALMKDNLAEGELCPIRLQALPRAEECIDNLGVKDPLFEKDHSPVPEVVHVYPDRVAFCVALLCPVYCRYCFRKRRDDEEGLHYNREIVERGIEYIRSQPAIRDVLITGGDPFIASDEAIIGLVKKLREIKHVEIIRFGTRTPVTLPYRVTKELAQKLSEYHPIYVNTHFNCAEELTPDAQVACENLVNAGIPVGNQSVLLRGINDDPERFLELCRGLLKFRVRPYYLFLPHAVQGTEHLRTKLKEGKDIMRYLRGRITGLGIPSFIVDTPNGKIPVLPDYELGQLGEYPVFEFPKHSLYFEKT